MAFDAQIRLAVLNADRPAKEALRAAVDAKLTEFDILATTGFDAFDPDTDPTTTPVATSVVIDWIGKVADPADFTAPVLPGSPTTEQQATYDAALAVYNANISDSVTLQKLAGTLGFPTE